ncbi:ThuA domain-containing protein [Oerskovia flava]|uniref:ThuA domain-containing protein n=1 Tax=Oerskovia flava TaxID=2986422 RepID=UPI002240E0EA|nr:ThuA domain-containing protein [Oerskovia sp. JB1-3-2]
MTMASAHDGPHEAGEEHKVLIFTKTTQFRHTEAITQGTPVLESAFAEVGIASDHTEDSTVFNDEDLAEYDALVMFQTSGDPWNADEKAALERYQQAGGGIVAIHNATDMRGSYDWWDTMIGALMPGHAATGNSPGLPGTVRVEDRTHPSTEHLEQRWDRADEWYNFSANVRGTAHVLATMDETTYAAGGNAMGYDHPISWCKPYDGGRSWMTGMGHFGAHYTQEPEFVQHIVGGVQWAAGLVEGDCGGTDWGQFEKVALDTNTSAPFAMDVAPDGRVFYTELVRGQIRVYDPRTQSTSTAITIPVYSGGEDGLLGIALDRDFEENGFLYQYYSQASSNDSDPANFFSRLSRFTVTSNGPGATLIEPDSEVVLMEIPARRLPDEPGHTGGGLIMDHATGDLYLGIGDDVNPHSEPSGGYAPISERNGTFHDARETSANTNDLRGKILRIHPEPDGTYSIPEGNLFAPGTDKTLPEIYAMGFRNPFRFTIDERTGNLGVADYSPDNGSDNPNNRGPAGISEWNLVKEPGFFGWPLCMGNNEPFRDVDYRTSPVTVGAFFDCDNPVNDSVRNTGLTELPPAQPADMWYGYQRSSVPGVIPAGGGLAPMGGPFYQFDPELESDVKFPEYYDGKPFFYEWARNKMYSIDLVDGGAAPGVTDVEKVNPFLPSEQFLAPIDSKFGPDGAMYVLDWGGGFGRDNPNSGLHRIDYVSGSRSPVAEVSATPDSGTAPLEVSFDGSESTDPEGEDLEYAWDFDGDGTTDSTEVSPTYTYTSNGVYDARLTVTDPAGKVGTATVPITVGNTRPEVDFNLPPNGSFFDFGDEITWDLEVTDAEDAPDGEGIDDADVIIQPALGHDEHAHPSEPLTGRTGSVATSLGGGHGEGMNVFYVLDGRYTDSGGEDGTPALTGSDTSLVFGKKREAEFHSATEGTTTSPSRDVEGGGSVIAGADGAWASYEPFNLYQIDALTVRVAAAAAGTVELRRDAPDGELLGTAEVPATGLGNFTDVRVDVTDPGETFTLYVVLPGAGERRVNFIEANGKGNSPTSRPEVAITAPAAGDELEQGTIEVVAEATDAENTVTEVEFFVDGTSLGVDDEAPFTAEWEVDADGYYALTAVATNDQGLTTTSRVVQAQVGDLFGGMKTFTNANGSFEQLAEGRFVITSGGTNMWQGVNQYSTIYREQGADENWSATVKINSQGNSHGSAKAGIIVRNDVTQTGNSPGYAALGIRPSGGFEWLRAGANGQLSASTAASTTSYPAWVRIERDGDLYTASWSKDGTNFTQIGEPQALPGAASVQDVGLFVTAHHATATSAVEFQDFVFDDDPAGPGEPGGGEPPQCLAPRSDEFDGDEVDSRWTVVREGDGQPITVEDGNAVLPVVQGDINEGEPGPISYLGQPVPDGEWTIETLIDVPLTRHWQHAGLLVHATDDEYTKLAFTKNQNGNRFLEFQTETAGTRTWHGQTNVATDFPSAIHLRLVSDGSAITAAYSPDGEAWTALAGSAPVKADATFGVMAAGDTAAPDTVALVDHVRITPDVEDGDDDGTREPSDEFEGNALDGCRWNAVVRWDGSKVEVADGELRITTQPGDINNDNPISPRNFILQDAPEGDWVAETRFKAPLVHRWQYAGLLAYADDDDYVKLDVVAKNDPGAALNLGAELVSEQNGGFGNGGNRALEIADSTESGYWYLRMAKVGDTYEGWVSDGGVNWQSLGQPVTHDADLTSVGLIAVGPEQETPVTVAFDWFRLTTDEGDTQAPEVSVSQSPEAGESGWSTEEVEVTATATDDVTESPTIEVSTDGGEWQPYEGPVTVSEDGEHTLAFRATDEAGNVSTEVTHVVRLDTVAPTASAELAGRTVTLTGDDTGSGLERLEYRIEGDTPDGEWLTYDEPFDVGAGAVEVAYRAVDVAGNVGETLTLSVPAAGGGVSVETEVRSQCLGTRAYVSVRVINTDDVPASITLSTPYGERTFAAVAPGKSAYQSFATRAAAIEAGTVTITASAERDGEELSSVIEAGYAAITCG